MAAKRKAPIGKRTEAKEENKRIRSRNRGEGGDTADWASIKPQVLADVIQAVSLRGCAIQFGYTRDGGAYCIRIVGDGEAYNEYMRPTEDVEKHIVGITGDFQA